jgi:hypothetical protein
MTTCPSPFSWLASPAPGRPPSPRPWPTTATRGCPWTRRYTASTVDTAWTTPSTPTSSANDQWSRRSEHGSSRSWRPGTTSSWTTGCGGAPSATPGSRPPAKRAATRLPAGQEELLGRLAERNQREDANALTVTPEALDDFFARFDPPADDEEVIVYTGDLDALVAALSAVRHWQV